jgi:hypothetical protein
MRRLLLIALIRLKVRKSIRCEGASIYVLVMRVSGKGVR